MTRVAETLSISVSRQSHNKKLVSDGFQPPHNSKLGNKSGFIVGDLVLQYGTQC